MTSVRARRDTARVGDECWGSKRRLGWETSVWARWSRWVTGAWARKNVVKVSDERSSSKRHGQGGRRAFGLEKTGRGGRRVLGLEGTRLGWETSVRARWSGWAMGVWARKNAVEVGDECLSSKRHGRGGRQAFGPEKTGQGGGRVLGLEGTRLGWEASVQARKNTVEVGDECSGLKRHGQCETSIRA